LFQHGVSIKLGMCRGIVAAVENPFVRLLRTVVGKWMSGNLPPGQPATVRESRQVNRVHGTALLKNLRRFFRALVHE